MTNRSMRAYTLALSFKSKVFSQYRKQNEEKKETYKTNTWRGEKKNKNYQVKKK
jgi:hypothetical protein